MRLLCLALRAVRHARHDLLCGCTERQEADAVPASKSLLTSTWTAMPLLTTWTMHSELLGPRYSGLVTNISVQVIAYWKR